MQSPFVGSIAVGLVLSLAPFTSYAQSGSNQTNDGSNAQRGGHHEAMQMVPARASLLTTIDAKKTTVGTSFQVKLVSSVQLKNGPKLPEGTLLTGSIENDDMQQGGTSRLAVRLTTATVKGGASTPIKATIVGVYHPDDNPSGGSSGYNNDSIPNSWNDGTLAVDQIGVMSDTDLHSRITSKNSGVFVSAKKDNITLRAGSQLQLAIAISQDGQSTGDSGMASAGAGPQ